MEHTPRTAAIQGISKLPTGVKSLEESMSDEAELPRLNAFEEARMGDLQLLRSESEHCGWE